MRVLKKFEEMAASGGLLYGGRELPLEIFTTLFLFLF